MDSTASQARIEHSVSSFIRKRKNKKYYVSIFPCPICKRVQTSDHFRRHLKTCGKSLSKEDYEQYAAVVRIKPNSAMEGTEATVFQCPYCLKCVKHFQMHKLRHHPERKKMDEQINLPNEDAIDKATKQVLIETYPSLPLSIDWKVSNLPEMTGFFKEIFHLVEAQAKRDYVDPKTFLVWVKRHIKRTMFLVAANDKHLNAIISIDLFIQYHLDKENDNANSIKTYCVHFKNLTKIIIQLLNIAKGMPWENLLRQFDSNLLLDMQKVSIFCLTNKNLNILSDFTK